MCVKVCLATGEVWLLWFYSSTPCSQGLHISRIWSRLLENTRMASLLHPASSIPLCASTFLQSATHYTAVTPCFSIPCRCLCGKWIKWRRRSINCISIGCQGGTSGMAEGKKYEKKLAGSEKPLPTLIGKVCMVPRDSAIRPYFLSCSNCLRFLHLSMLVVLSPLAYNSRGGTLRPKMDLLFACSQGMGSLTGTFQTQLWYLRFQCSWAWNVQIRGPIPKRPRREPYFMSSHMLYLTSQRTKLSEWFSVIWNP